MIAFCNYLHPYNHAINNSDFCCADAVVGCVYLPACLGLRLSGTLRQPNSSLTQQSSLQHDRPHPCS